jgi:hypothetical protein
MIHTASVHIFTGDHKHVAHIHVRCNGAFIESVASEVEKHAKIRGCEIIARHVDGEVIATGAADGMVRI